MTISEKSLDNLKNFVVLNENNTLSKQMVFFEKGKNKSIMFLENPPVMAKAGMVFLCKMKNGHDDAFLLTTIVLKIMVQKKIYLIKILLPLIIYHYHRRL